MTKKEIDRVVMVKKIESRQISQVGAAKNLGISDRQMRRLWRRYRADGEGGLMSKKRGKPSNRQINPHVKERALKLIYENYRDFGPTLAKEKLQERHRIKLSTETVRKLMIVNGIWQPRKSMHPSTKIKKSSRRRAYPNRWITTRLV